MKSLNLIFVAFFGLMLASGANTVWDEDVDGDLSNAYLNPTQIALSFGSQSIFGAVTPPSGQDRDLFTIEVPAGGELTAFRLLSYASSDPNNITFLGVQEGSTLSQAPSNSAGGFTDAIGYALFGFDDIGRDLLPVITGNPFIPPFFGENPLPAGEYAIWVNETATGAGYGLELEVSPIPVPEPSISLLGLMAAFFLGCRRRRKGSI